MGRHADPDGGSFYRSLAVAALKALAVLLVVAAVTVGIVTFATNRGDSPAVTFPEAEDVIPTPVVGTPVPTPAPSPTPPAPAPVTPMPTPAVETPGPQPTTSPEEDLDEEVLVQVLDAGAGADAAQRVAELLEELGYVVEAVNSTRCCESRTTVLYTAGNRRHAEALVEADERFGRAAENDRFSDTVHLHVLLGEDWDD